MAIMDITLLSTYSPNSSQLSTPFFNITKPNQEEEEEEEDLLIDINE